MQITNNPPTSQKIDGFKKAANTDRPFVKWNGKLELKRGDKPNTFR